MTTEEDREKLAVELRKVYMRTPATRGMDAPRWAAVADAAIAALRRTVQDDRTLQGQAKLEEECVPDDLCPECCGMITSWFCEPCGNTGKVTRSGDPS